MYIPHYYKNENITEVKDFLVQNSFGILINQVKERPWGTHLPLELETDKNGKDVLVGHLARANPQWKDFEDNPEVLCVFNGPHAYISSSWYQKEEVPTWNYIAVHIYGTIKIMEGETLMLHLKRLVDKYETTSEAPISLERLSSKTLAQVQGVVGFEIEITEIQAAYKLSQTRKEDHDVIIKELKKRNEGSKAVAKAMKKS